MGGFTLKRPTSGNCSETLDFPFSSGTSVYMAHDCCHSVSVLKILAVHVFSCVMKHFDS